nr:MBL fold metallo-hydrolase [Deinobacterium chartae]
MRFLGTSDSKGVPRWWCECPVCTDARAGGPNRRTRPSALLSAGAERLLLDFGPDLHAQLTREGITQLTHAVVTHAHNDHLLGLGDLLDAAPLGGPDPSVYAPAAVLPQVRERFGYAFRKREAVRPLPEQGLAVCGFVLRAFEVPHGFNGTSFGLRFDAPGYRWAYVTDAIDISGAVQQAWMSDLDLLVLGTTFYHEQHPRAGRSVYDVTEALELPAARTAKRVILTHLGHDVDVRCGRLPDPRFAYAREGLRLELPT